MNEEQPRLAQKIEEKRRQNQRRVRDSKETRLRINPQGEGNMKLIDQEEALASELDD